MRLLSSAFAILSAALVCNPTWADGLIYQLPADGTWVRYDIQIEGTGRSEGRAPRELKVKGSFTVSLVGQAMDDGVKCRWVEIKSEVSEVGKPKDLNLVLLKLLIPEENLKRGKDPLDDVRRIYYSRKISGGEVTPVEKIEEPWRKRYEIERFRSFFPKPLEAVKRLGKETVVTGIGRLECEVMSGKSSLPKSPLRDGAEWAWEGKFEILLNDATPFGVASMRSERTGYETSTGKNSRKTETDTLTILTLSEVGDKAVSDLPLAK